MDERIQPLCSGFFALSRRCPFGKLQGEIQLTVRLNRKGLPARIKLIQRLSPSCNREAIRLVEEYPGKWENTEKEILLTIPFKLPATE